MQLIEVGDDKKKVKLITRAMTPLIFGTAFVLCSLLYIPCFISWQYHECYPAFFEMLFANRA